MTDNQTNTETTDLAIRVKKIIESKNMTNYAFEKAIGVTRNSIHNLVESNGGIGADKLAKIIARYPDVNSKWLLTGEGDVFSDALQVINYLAYKPNVTFYEINASAGGLTAAQDEQGHLLEAWHIPQLIGDHIAVSVEGQSMSPTINEGDRIVAKEVFRNDLRDGRIYIIVTADNAVRVKRLRLYDNTAMLWSDNVLYQPRSEKLEIESVIKLYHVVMAIRPI